MDDAISTIPNLGPASEASFARAGIATASVLRNLGADAAYLRLLQSGTSPHFIGFYALVMGLQGRPWNDCRGDEKIALRKRFDTIKAQAGSSASATPTGHSAALEQALNAMGVIENPARRPPDQPSGTKPARNRAALRA